MQKKDFFNIFLKRFRSVHKLTNDVFISYAKEDEGIVRRVYQDLTRNGLKCWEFKARGKSGVDFENEFINEIENSRFFCLMDSSWARDAKYVATECGHAQMRLKKAGHPQMIVCRIEKGNEWRRREIFERQNYIVSIDLTDYDTGIKRLCKALRTEYHPQFTLPQDKDFLDEMSEIRMHQSDISTRDWQQLMDNYERFRSKYNLNNRLAEATLIGIIGQTEDLKIDLKAPYLVLGILQADASRHQDALSTFKNACRKFPDDPRFWAALGAAHFSLNHYDSALDSYCRCLAMINSSDNDDYISHTAEVAHNLEQVLCAMGKFDEAHKRIEAQFSEYEERPAIQSILGQIYMFLDNPGSARVYLENAFNFFIDKQDLTFYESNYLCHIILNLAQCYHHLGKINKEQQLLVKGLELFPHDAEMARGYAVWLFRSHNYKETVKYFQKAIDYSSGNIKYRAELALVLYELGNVHQKEYKNQLRQCFLIEKNREILIPIDNYYLGLAYFLDDQSEVANYHYRLSKEDRKISNWPYYDQLTSKTG